MPVQGYTVKVHVEVERETENTFDNVIKVDREFDLPPGENAVADALDSVRDTIVRQLRYQERDRDSETPSTASGEV